MLVKVPYLVHMDAVVDTVEGTVTRVEIHSDTVFLNRDRQGFPVLNENGGAVGQTTARKAIAVAESVEWPAWDND